MNVAVDIVIAVACVGFVVWLIVLYWRETNR